MNPSGRAARLLFLMMLLASALAAQPGLVAGDPNRAAMLLGPAGTTEPRRIAAEPAPRISVVVFPGTIPPEQRTRTVEQLVALYKSAGRPSPLTLAAFTGREFTPAGRFPTAAAWQSALREALSSAATETAPAAGLYHTMAAEARNFGDSWSSVLLVGRLPDLEPDVRDYAQAWMAVRFCGQKLRVSYWDPAGAKSEFWNGVAEATGGIPGVDSPADFLPASAAGPFTELSWPAPPWDRGFLLYRGEVRDGAGVKGAELPMLAAAAAAELPDIDRYRALRSAAGKAAELARLEKPDAGQGEEVRALVEQALGINPMDGEALGAGAGYYRRNKDYKTAASLLARLTQITPGDAGRYAELGHCQFAAGDLDAAETALRRAREGKAGGAAVPEELARIRLAHGDDAGALPLLDEALAFDARNSALWFTRADSAARLGDWSQSADSLEKGLALDEKNLKRRTSLVALYLEHAADRALRHIQYATAALPPDAAVGRQYAEFLDQLGRPEEALPVWRQALASDPAMEAAHFRIARILLDRGAFAEGLAAAERGIEAAPVSPRLHLAKSEALERQGRYFDARESLRAAAKSLPDAALLARLAEMEDISGISPAEGYAALADAREHDGRNPAGAAEALERGLEVALREGDQKSRMLFSARLTALGKNHVSDWLALGRESSPGGAVVPGGLEALAFVAQAHFRSPRHFLADYCRTLVDRTAVSDHKVAAAYLESIRQYFQLVAGLRSLGTRKGDRVELVVSLADKKARQQSEKILGLLGWKLRTSKDEVTLEAGEKAAQAKRQDTASALTVDEVGMQDALQAGRSFRFEVVDALAPVLLDEARWRSTFFPKEELNGGLAEGLARDVRVAKVYAALSAMSAPAVAALSAGADLKTLAEKYADLLYGHAAAFALEGDRAAVPGGAQAVPVWEKLVGSPVATPSRFFRALLEKDEGKLLAFFATLGELDAEHQRFFTRSPARTARFYELFRDSRDMVQGAAKQTQSSAFVEFLREIPLDSEGRVLFPGGPGAWIRSNNDPSSSYGTGKLARKLSRIALPEQEDEILSRLARTSYSIGHQKLSESNKFVAVVRIDQHRSEPLDEASAWLLAQHCETELAVYPYFAALTALGKPQFERFFALTDRLRPLGRLQLNLVLGELHSLIELLCLAQESGALEPAAAAELFGRLCDRFAKAVSEADTTSASLASLRELVNRAAPKDAAGDPDSAIERVLLGDGGPVAFTLDGMRRELDPRAVRSAAYRRVLAEQKVTALKTVLEFDDVLQAVAQGKGSAAEQLQTLDSLRAGLLTVDLPKSLKADAVDRKIVLAFDPARVAGAIARLKQRTARKKVDRKEVDKLCQELLAAIAPQVKVALSGIVYAYFLGPDDLLVSQDPLLLRKHQFLDLGVGGGELFPPADLAALSEGAGSHLNGGFADFSVAAGKVALAGGKSDRNSEFIATAQIASLRATDWSRVREQDLLLFGLRLRLAREWVLRAGANAGLLADLAADTPGVLSPNRRAQLLDAIRSRDWDEAFQTMTLGDLYALSDRYLGRYTRDPWQSPVTVALRKLAPEPGDGRLRRLGGSSIGLSGCDHSHLAFPGPYEQYEKLVLPYKLAQRAAEFKLYLADLAGRLGIPPAALSLFSEPAALAILAKAHMSDMRDWRAVNLAFAAVDQAVLLAALEKQK